MTSESWQHIYFIFTKTLVIVQSVDCFSNCFLMCWQWQFKKMAKSTSWYCQKKTDNIFLINNKIKARAHHGDIAFTSTVKQISILIQLFLMTIIQQDNNNIWYPKSIQDENINGVTICPHVISKLPKMSRFRLWLPSLSSSIQALYIIYQMWHAREIYKDWIASISNTHTVGQKSI